MDKRKITIFGSGKAMAGQPGYEVGYDVGKVLAQEDFVVVNGGYGGVMEACSKGAKEAGGEVIGVTCLELSQSGPNEFISKEIQTNTLEKRLGKLMELGDAYVVLPGGTGTLAELALVWEYQNKGLVESPKPIILVSDFWRPLVKMMAEQDLRLERFVNFADGAEEVVNALMDNL